jgi:hypothetical protein
MGLRRLASYVVALTSLLAGLVLVFGEPLSPRVTVALHAAPQHGDVAETAEGIGQVDPWDGAADVLAWIPAVLVLIGAALMFAQLLAADRLQTGGHAPRRMTR